MTFFKPYEKNCIRRPSETIYEAIITDPEKRAKVLELLTQEGLVTPNENASPNRLQQQKARRMSEKGAGNIQPSLIKQLYSPKHINKPKVRMESPSALCRRRALEALNADSDTLNTIPKPVTFDIGSLLSGVVGYCEVRSSAGDDRSVAIKAMMKLMGATVFDNFTREVTHVVFKDGTFATYQKAKLLNVHLVSVFWLEAVRRTKCHVPEAKYPVRGVEDPNSSTIALTIQNEFDDIIKDEYRESQGASSLVRPRDNHVTQRRFKSMHRNDHVHELEDEISKQMRLMHSSPKPSTSNHNTDLSKSNSYYSLNSNSSNNDDIVPCSQDARTSLSKTHQTTYNPLEIIEAHNSHDVRRNKYTKSHETINELPKVTKTHEIIEESPEISPQNTSRIAKHAKDSFELPKAQKIRSPESLESRRLAIQETREAIEKNSDEMQHLHITTSDESNNVTKSSSNSTSRISANNLVRNPINYHRRRKTISSGSSTNNLIVDDGFNFATPSSRAARYSNRLISEAESIKNGSKSVGSNRRMSRSTTKQNSNKNCLSKPASLFLEDSNSSEGNEEIVEQQNTSKNAPTTPRRNESSINKRLENDNSKSSSEENDQQDILDSAKRTSKVSRADKKLRRNTTTEIHLDQQHDLDVSRNELKTPKSNKKTTTKPSSSKGVDSGKENNTAQIKFKTLSTAKISLEDSEISRHDSARQKRKSSRQNKAMFSQSSSEDDEQENDLNSAKTMLKTPINSQDKFRIENGRNSAKQIHKRNYRKTNNTNSDDQGHLKSKNLNQNKELENDETGCKIRSKNEILKSSSEINITKATNNLNATQSAPNLISINQNDKNNIEQPKKLRLRKLYSANDSIDEALFNCKVVIPSVITNPVKKVKHQVQMLQEFDVPKTLSKRARAVVSTRKPRAATTKKAQAATSTKTNQVQTEPKNFNNLKSGSSSDRSTKNKRISKRLIFESGSSESDLALATPTTRKSMRISKRMIERSAESTCSSESNDKQGELIPSLKQIENSATGKRQSASSVGEDSESSRSGSPRKRSRNSRVLHFNSSSETESETYAVRRTRKSIKQVDQKSKKPPLKTKNRSKTTSKKLSSPDEVIDRRSTLEFQHKSSRESLQKMRLTQKPKIALKLSSIVCTRLHKADVEVFQQIVKELGGFIVEDEVTERTTHLIAGGPARTINILRAIARGCWVLRHEWLYKSLEAGKWLEEEEYELTEFSPVVQASRRQKQAFGPLFSMDVFKNVGEIFICRSSTPRFSDLEELVTLCGGKIVSLQRKAKICVGEFVRSENTTCVNEKWILDSITQNKKKALKNYLIIGSQGS